MTTARYIFACILLTAAAVCLAIQPADVKWVAVGTTTQPAGVAVPLTADRQASIANWLTPLPPPVTPWTRISQPRQMTDAWPAATRLWVDGQRFNISVDGSTKPIGLAECLSTNAIRATATQEYDGQNLYIDHAPAGATITGLYACGAGWQQNPKIRREPYQHGYYGNFAVGPTIIQDSWFDDNAMAGIQTRAAGGAIIRRCLLTRNSVNLLLVMGDVSIEDCTVYDSGRYYLKSVPCWQGNVALDVYTRVRANNLWLVGGPNQRTASDAKLKNYDLGAIQVSNKYGKEEWTPPKNSRGVPDVNEIGLTATNCRLVGWVGLKFVGSRPFKGDGFVVGGEPVDAWPALDRIRADLMAGRITVAQATEQGQAAVRSLVH